MTTPWCSSRRSSAFMAGLIRKFVDPQRIVLALLKSFAKTRHDHGSTALCFAIAWFKVWLFRKLDEQLQILMSDLLRNRPDTMKLSLQQAQ